MNPSPKFHCQLVTNPSGSRLPDPSKKTCCPAIGLVGERVKLAMGGWSGGGGGAVIFTLDIAEWFRLPLVALTMTIQVLDPPGGGVFDAVMISVPVNMPPDVSVKELGTRVAVGKGAPGQQAGITFAMRVPV